MNPLRVGVLGCGRIALGTHLPVLSAMPEVKIVALAEPDAGLRQRALAIANDAAATADWREMIAQEQVDAVVVCLPTGLHAEAAVAALGARKHVYLEKPVAGGMDDARRVLDAWRDGHCAGMIGFNYRFNPLAVELRRQIAAGRIGKVIGVQSVFCTQATELAEWKAHRASGGGVLLDLASHHVDLIRFLLQAEVQDVFARITSLKSEADTATLDLRTTGGAPIHSFFCLRSVEENRLDVFGTDGKLSLDFYRSTQIEFTAPSRGGDPVSELAGLPGNVWRRGRKLIASKLGGGAHLPAYRAALAEFVASVRESRSPSCDLNDGFASLAVIDAAERSAELGGVIRLAPIPAYVQRPSPTVSTPIIVPRGLQANGNRESPASSDPGTMPRITVIAITPDCYQTIRQTVRHLAAQTIAHELELIICVGARSDLREVRSELAPFHSCQIVELGTFTTMGAAKIVALRQARSPFIIFAEDHSFPEPGWAAALVEAHAAGHVAAGPQMQNANPGSMLSWADLFLGFGSWIGPLRAGVRDGLPWHNSGYDRQLLLTLGSSLEPMLENEGLLQMKLRAEGRSLFLALVATRHVNTSRLGSFLLLQYHGGRSFGGGRAEAENWAWHRRLLHVVGAPLVPLLRLRQTLNQIRACGRTRELVPRILPCLFIGLCAHAAGEAMGIALGVGTSRKRKSDFEFHRDQHVSESDKIAWAF